MRPNAATANTVRFEAAVAARDADALTSLLADDLETVHHPTGTTAGKAVVVGDLTSRLQQDLRYRSEPLATLGDALALFRVWISASRTSGRDLDVGAWEFEAVVLQEVDAEGRRQRTESFAADRLGDALARLYARYAELLTEGPERRCAAALARLVAAMQAPPALERWGAAFASDIEFVDRRTLGDGPEQGADAVLRASRALLDLSDDLVHRIDDILGARTDALLLRTTNTGTLRASGGSFEMPNLLLFLLGPDGRATRLEQFDSEGDAEALARFDALTGAHRRPLRPVRPNAATANAARIEAAIAARDADALSHLLADTFEFIDHPMALTSDRQAMLLNYRFLLSAREPKQRFGPLASLGESLALFHFSVSASGLARGNLDVGVYEYEGLTLIEVDEQGRSTRNERFAIDHLGDAVVRLYERYAERLPDGSERARAAATARSVAMLLGPQTLDRYASALAPAIEIVDHRILGTVSSCGAEAALQTLGSFLALTDDFAVRTDEILAVTPGALLLRLHSCGTDRAGGGAFERPNICLQLFGTDGLMTRCEFFDPENAATALARFDELTAPPKGRVRRVPANAATANASRVDAAVAARDEGALAELLADSYENVHHPLSLTFDRQQSLSSFRMLLSAREPRHRHAPLASLGDSLALVQLSVSASGLARGSLDVGAYELEHISLIEVDEQGRKTRDESFTPDQLGAAVTRLYERYAERLEGGPERARAALTARLIAGIQAPSDPSHWASAWAPAIEFVDRRTFGVGTVQGADELLRNISPLHELSDNTGARFDDLLDARQGALLVRCTNTGTDRSSGGVYERVHLLLFLFGADGRITRIEQLDSEREAEALARFDELTAAATVRPRRVRPNAATANAARIEAAVAARDADALGDLYGDALEAIDHRMSLTYDRQQLRRMHRMLLGADGPALHYEPLASLGDSLALFHDSISAGAVKGGALDVASYELECVLLIEVDTSGRVVRNEAFAEDHLGDAILRLYERYAELLPGGAERELAAATACSFATQLVRLAPNRYASALSPVVEQVDHRILGTWSARGVDAVLQSFGSLSALAHDIAMCIDDVLCLERGALLVRGQARGTDRAGGGVFETTPMLSLVVAGADGLLARLEFFDIGRDAEALARFDELRPDPLRILPNAAWHARDRHVEAWQAGDWDALRALASADFVFEDRSKHVQLSGGVEMWLENNRFVRAGSLARELIGTAGDRIALERTLWQGELDGGPVEMEHLRLTEVDAEGRIRASIRFDLEDRSAAFFEAQTRFAAGEAAGVGGQAPMLALASAFAQHEWDAARGCLADDFVLRDHRTLGFGALRREEWIGSLRAFTELAPDWSGEAIRTLAWNRHGRVAMQRTSGTMPDGGGPFENVMVQIAVTDGARIRHIELFDVAEVERALARFEELCAGLP